METAVVDSSTRAEVVKKEAPQLVSVLKEMKGGLDVLTSKIEALTAKVEEKEYPTADGISYLEAKHLLLLSYCQSLVYYLLRKAKGLPIKEHPVVQSLVEIRLFLDKVRGIDKKMQYQLHRLSSVSDNAKNVTKDEQEPNATEETDDLRAYHPNQDMDLSQSVQANNDGSGVYRAPKFAPALMDEDKMSKQEKNALRKEQLNARQLKSSTYWREKADEMEGRPEEVREIIGNESRELTRYLEKRQRQERLEEETFSRAPLTKMDKKREKHLLKSRNGLLGLVENPLDDFGSLLGGLDGEMKEDRPNSTGGGKKYKKRKARH